MHNNAIPIEFLPYIEGILLALMYTLGRNSVTYKDFFFFSIPKWLRRLLCIADNSFEKINLNTIVCQSITVISIVIYILGYLGFNLLNGIEWIMPAFSKFHGQFSIQFAYWIIFYWFAICAPMAVYVAICDIVI